MTFKSSNVLLGALLLLAASPLAANAQIDLQQKLQGNSGSERSKADVAGAVRSAGLGVVPPDFAQLKLAPGFLLNLSVLEDSDFEGSFRVDQDGNITVPVLGAIHVAGDTASEARNRIRQKLLDGNVLKDPQVVLSVAEYTAPEVTILGEVSTPGKYPLLAPHKLIDVLALAGGTTMMAGNEIEITGSGGGEQQPSLIHYSKATAPKDVENVLVHSGDTVIVKRAGIVYVLGAVNRPGGFVMQENGTLNVLQAVALAYGTSNTAATGTFYLLRRNADGTVARLEVPYRKMAHGKRADVELHAADILFVPTSGLKAVFANTQQVLSAAATASVYGGLGY